MKFCVRVRPGPAALAQVRRLPVSNSPARVVRHCAQDSTVRTVTSDEFLITRNDTDEAVVLQVSGVIDIITAPSLATQLDIALAGTPPVLVVDLNKVDFLSSAGITVLVEAHRLTQNSATSLRVAADGSATSRPLQIVGVDKIVELYPTVDDAVRGRQP